MVYRVFKLGILFLVLTVAILVLLIDKVAKFLSSSMSPKSSPIVLGGINPPGASKIVKTWEKGIVWLAEKAQKKLGGYINRNHPRVFSTLGGVFSWD